MENGPNIFLSDSGKLFWFPPIHPCGLDPCYSKCGPQPKNIGVTPPGRLLEFDTMPEAHSIYISTRFMIGIHNKIWEAMGKWQS